jgi:hypothetical protein
MDPAAAGAFFRWPCERLQGDWLKQIIDAKHFEGVDSIVVISGRKDYRDIDLYVPEKIEYRPVGKMDVHEQKVDVRNTLIEQGYALFDAFELRDNLCSRIDLPKQEVQPFHR